MWLEVQDLLLLVKLMKDPPDNFHLRDYIVAISSSTRASSKNHLKHPHSHMPRLNSTKFFYFNRYDKNRARAKTMQDKIRTGTKTKDKNRTREQEQDKSRTRTGQEQDKNIIIIIITTTTIIKQDKSGQKQKKTVNHITKGNNSNNRR